jgi:hypothetical protein
MGQGSITGSILEENEDSSDDGNGNYTVHENRPAGGRASSMTGRSGPPKAAPIGVPSVTAPRNGGRRAASDIGYTAPTSRRQSLRRTFSNSNDHANNERADSDASSARDFGGGGKKKGGFFSKIAKMFKGDPSRQRNQGRSGRDSPGPVYQGSKGGWSTRTDTNIRRSNSMYGGGRGGDDSSDDEDNGNLVAVSNNRNSTFSVDTVGRNNSKRSSMPVAAGLIPAKPASRPMGQRSDSQSTVTGRQSGNKTPTQRPSSRASTVKSAGTAPVRSSANAPVLGAPVARTNIVKSTSTTTAPGISRSNTMRSTTSTATAKSSPAKQRIRPNGSISRIGQQSGEGRSIMSLVDSDQPPPMPEVPKAPRSQVTPQMELPRAPGSSIVPVPTLKFPAADGGAKSLGRSNSTAAPGSLARSNSSKRVSQAPPSPPRSTTPLPPSRLMSPPLKSALRPTSPNPNDNKSVMSEPALPPPQMFSVTAPGPVKLPVEEKPAPVSAPMVNNTTARPYSNKRNSFHSTTTADGESVYESAQEDGQGQEEDEDSSSDEEHDDSKYKVYENDRSVQAGMNVGPPAIERIPSDRRDEDSGDESDGTAQGVPAAEESEQPQLAKRKSVRMNVPDSPAVTAPPPVTPATGHDYSTEDRAPSPEPTKPDSAPWSSRIGQADVDSEDERDPEYMNARRGLKKNTGKWEAIKDAASPKRSKSTRSKNGSVKGRA